MERILIVQTGFHGDVVLSSPVWVNVRRLYPDAHICVLTTPQAKELVCYHPDVDEVLVFDKRGSQNGISGFKEMIKELRGRSFTMVFCLHKSWRTAVLMYLSGIPLRYGFSQASGAWLYSRTVSRKDCNHEVLRNLAILRHCELEPINADSKLSLYLSKQAENEADSLLKNFCCDSKLIGIAVGSVWATKRWTVDGFCSVAKELITRGFKIVLIGGVPDALIANEVEKRVGAENQFLSNHLLNLVGKTSFIVSAAVINKCNVFLTNDSAPMHIAASLGVPVVCVFCATVPEFGYGPWGVPYRIHEVKGLKCRPCGRHGMQHCPSGTHMCQLAVDAKDVTESVMSLYTASKNSIEL